LVILFESYETVVNWFGQSSCGVLWEALVGWRWWWVLMICKTTQVLGENVRIRKMWSGIVRKVRNDFWEE